ncbi:MAG: NAD regulator [Nitratireductor sp.]|nr:NAD regulator [Nitratireductor sp.]MCC0020437.1 NAD regulator [Nitratireductor sp.]
MTGEFEIGLNAAIVAILDNNPVILTIPGKRADELDSLPYGPFRPGEHRTMEIGLRQWVEEQTNLRLGYVEQLYTFADRGRHRRPGDAGPHVISVGYLALTRPAEERDSQISDAGWRNCYHYLPWEDWRTGRPQVLDEVILPRIKTWILDHEKTLGEGGRSYDHNIRNRARIAFGLNGIRWDEERALERYELMYSAGMVEEAVADGRITQVTVDGDLGQPMRHDHRRILATALARLRAKLKYRPVVFELMDDEFTLFQLQQTVESILGHTLHKQNFRRLVETNQLVEPTGATSLSTGGRPAALFKFRREVMAERPAPGLRLGRS